MTTGSARAISNFGCLILAVIPTLIHAAHGSSQTPRIAKTQCSIPTGEKNMMDMKKDPVCSMEVDKDKSEFTSQYGGKTYYFCSEDCKQQFERRPEQFAIAA
jgi:Cu+-exporting ATPase